MESEITNEAVATEEAQEPLETAEQSPGGLAAERDRLAKEKKERLCFDGYREDAAAGP